jgi:hypothetical protein
MPHFARIHSSSHAMNLLYIDPGAGSLVVQAVLAAALAIPFVLRTHIGRAVQRLRDLRGQRHEPRSPGD